MTKRRQAKQVIRYRKRRADVYNETACSASVSENGSEKEMKSTSMRKKSWRNEITILYKILYKLVTVVWRALHVTVGP